MKTLTNAGYNERLFSGGIRGFFHSARFHWLRGAMQRVGASSRRVIELGCFDGRAIDYLPTRPEVYRGYDAGWEGGLEAGREKWPQYSFTKATKASDISLNLSERFDIAIALETLEHVPQAEVSPYLAKLAQHVDGYLFVSVPNEIGPLFLAKWLAKRIVYGDAHAYTWPELFYATIGRTDKVARHEHKGFNYRRLAEEISQHFDLLSVEGIPYGPPITSFFVGIIAKHQFT